MSRRFRGEDGQLLILIIGYALLAAALVVVAVDASAFFLAKRSLAALADGAAVAGTHAEDEGSLYAGGAPPGGDLPLDPDAVRREVTGYLDRRDAVTAYPELRLVRADTDGATVTVTLTEDKALPFLGLVSSLTGAFPGGTATVGATASAHAPVTP